MPRESGFAGTPAEWLRRARGNLALARQPKPPEALWEDVCFEAQQAAEKAMKGVLVLRGIDFPKTHDLNSLLSLLQANGEDFPEEFWEAVPLTAYAHELRYPGVSDPVTEDDHHQALAMAEKVVAWAEKLVQQAGS